MSEGIDLIVKPKIFVTHQTVTVEVAITALEDTFRILIKFAGFLQTHKNPSFERFPENLPSPGDARELSLGTQALLSPPVPYFEAAAPTG
jgi:hypothetical protein